MRRLAVLLTLSVLWAAPVLAQTSDWREVPAENLLVIDTTEGRVLVELMPEVAPNHVQRIQTLVRRGFYDGLSFHRVMPGFMAQTGDPQGTGLGGSDLPDVQAEFTFRRGAEPAFVPIEGTDRGLARAAGVQLGLFGVMPVQTQPDGQMFATRDGRVEAQAWFCTGVVGAARTAGDVNTANSQFFIMNASGTMLNGQYTAFGRVVGPMDAVMALQPGEGGSGIVPEATRDRMTRLRMAADIPVPDRPRVRVLNGGSARFAELIETRRAARGASFSLCDVAPLSEVFE